MEKENIVLTVGYQNPNAFIVSVETVVRRGIFQFDIIGLANKTISESKQRILSAITSARNERRHYINKKITTLLSPADSKKEGSHFDLPIAISYLISSNALSDISTGGSTSRRTNGLVDKTVGKNLFSRIIILGELTLTGSVLPIKHISVLIRTGLQNGISHFVIPEGNRIEATQVDGISIWSVTHISEIIDVLHATSSTERVFDKFIKTSINGDESVYKDADTRKADECGVSEKTYSIDSIQGNETAKRALEISLAGEHHLLLIGTPGSGKSLLAKAARELLPEMTSESGNIFQLQNFAVNNNGQNDSLRRPFREPHHTASYSEIIGGGIQPGEIVLAHGGILFLDELAEFNRRVLESLRQPLENKYIQRGLGDPIPANFILIACMNPCDCGFYRLQGSRESKGKQCLCVRSQIDKYQRKMRSPLFQRFELCIYFRGTVGSGDSSAKTENNERIMGKTIAKNVLGVRVIRRKRMRQLTEKQYGKNHSASENQLSMKAITLLMDLQNLKSLRKKEKETFDEMCIRFGFSKREEMSLLRVARTIADLESLKDSTEKDQCDVKIDIAINKPILEKHLFEACSYRSRNN